MAESTEPTTFERSSSIKVRRGLAMLFMTLIIPGSAQLAGGSKRLGRVAVRVWGATLIVMVVFGVLALVRVSWVGAILANGLTLTILAVVVGVLGVGWGILFFDACRLSRPGEMSPKHRAVISVISAVMCLGMIGGSLAAANSLRAAASFIETVFPGGGETKANQGRFNILLIGADSDSKRVGVRADSINVASIDANTGRTVLFGLPRNLESVPFPESSPLHKLYPNGYWCKSHECMLNAIYTLGQQHKSLYPGVSDPGVKATTEAVEATLGITINYFAMIDMPGFVKLIDAVGGITISTNLKVPIGGGTSKVSGYIGPGKNLKLDGYHALWFARSREGASDYERMARQKCVMNAMLHQLDPMTVFTKFSQIAEAGKQVIATDVPSSEIGTLLDLADKGRKLPIKTVSFVPPLIATGDPNLSLIRSTVKQAIEQSEAIDSGQSATPKPAPSKATSKATAKATPKSGSTGNSDDLNAICQVG